MQSPLKQVPLQHCAPAVQDEPVAAQGVAQSPALLHSPLQHWFEVEHEAPRARQLAHCWGAVAETAQ